MASELPETSKRQAWFCTTGLPSDVVLDVGDMTFHLHKFPLMAKSKKLHEMITEQERNHTPQSLSEHEDNNEEIQETKNTETETEHAYITLPDFPGGSETFEAAIKYCYSVKIELSPSNVAKLRCAGEVLEMTDEYCEDNLINKTERFLSQTVFRSLKDSIITLKSCEELLPLADSLGIVQRCIDSIVSKASSSDPSLFGWPVNKVTNPVTEVSSHESSRRKKTYNIPTARVAGGEDMWFDELRKLSPSLFKRVILAIKSRDLNPEIIEHCLVSYAKARIPGVNRVGRRSSSSSIPSEVEQRELLETIITNLPTETGVKSSQTVALFFGMLRAANILNTSDACKSTLEKKIGLQLEQATLDDLLIPSYSYLKETLYDVDCVQRILAHFLHTVEQLSTAEVIEDEITGDEQNRNNYVELMLVGKLIDGYLSEIASDNNLKPEKFLELAFALPEQARLYDDGLYRSVDVYLKVVALIAKRQGGTCTNWVCPGCQVLCALCPWLDTKPLSSRGSHWKQPLYSYGVEAHPWLNEADREKICGAMDCRKLTLEACTHAAQNERLPLRAVVQVLFFEQLQLRQAIAGTLVSDMHRVVEQQDESVAEDEVVRGVGTTWTAAVRENQVLRLDMDSMRTRMNHLERECSTMRRAIEKIDKVEPVVTSGRRGSIWKNFGCKFKAQVCDSHEPAHVQARRDRTHRHLKQH